MMFLLQNGQGLKRGVTVDEEGEKAIWQVLTNNADLFAWTTTDLLGVDLRIASHRLSIFSKARSVSQKKRKLGEKRRLAVKAKKLL